MLIGCGDPAHKRLSIGPISLLQHKLENQIGYDDQLTKIHALWVSLHPTARARAHMAVGHRPGRKWPSVRGRLISKDTVILQN